MPLRGISPLTPSKVTSNSSLHKKKVEGFLLSLFELFTIRCYFGVYFFSFFTEIRTFFINFLQPKYESASKCNVSDVGDTSGTVMHCNGCFNNGKRVQSQQYPKILRQLPEFRITCAIINDLKN